MNKTFVKQVLKDFIDLGEVEIKTGPFGTQLHASDYVEKGTSVINVRNIGYGRIKTDKLEYINEETVQRLSSHLLKHNDIVFGRKGAVDRHALIGPNQQGWFQGSDCLRIRIKSDSVDPRYLSYCFLTDNHKKWMMAQCSHGATMASLNQDIISRIQVCLPNIQIQQKIASILATYDNLIENNTRRIEILEQMAKLIYEEWFFKFRFPGHENVKMISSELGEIPKGWGVKKLEDICSKISSGGTPARQNSDFWEEGNILWFKTKELTDGYLFQSEEKITENGLKNSSAKLFPKGTIIMAIYAAPTVGRLGILTKPSTFNQAACGLIPNTEILTTSFLYLKLLEMRSYFNSLAQGAAQQNINVSKVREAKIIVPPIKLVKIFDDFVGKIMDETQILSAKNQNLRKTRDLLLPKLISGVIDVSDLDIRIKSEFQE